jgi:hypothetical protein
MSHKRIRTKHFFIFTVVLLTASSVVTNSGSSQDKASLDQLRAIQKYIKQSWHTLKRSAAQLPQAAPDPKFKPMADGRWPVYVSRRENIKQIEQSLQSQLRRLLFDNCRTIRVRFESMGCSIYLIRMSSLVDDSMRCMVGTVISLRWDLCEMVKWCWPKTWSTTFCTRSSIMAEY